MFSTLTAVDFFKLHSSNWPSFSGENSLGEHEKGI